MSWNGVYTGASYSTHWQVICEQLLHRTVQRIRGGLVFKAHRLCVSLHSRLESHKEEEEGPLREIIQSK